MKKFYKTALTILLCATSVSGMEPQNPEYSSINFNLYSQEKNCFFDAIKDGNINLVKKLLKSNKKLVVTPMDSMSPIFYSVLFGQIDIAKILYDIYPQSIFLQNSFGKNALSLTIEYLNEY